MTVRLLDADEATARATELGAILIACVADGASVGWVTPPDSKTAAAFWREVAAGVARSERLLLVAEEDGALLGTVGLALAGQPNGAHRAELVKLLVLPAARRRGIGATLLAAAEATARAAGRTLLVLDTADPGAERLYARAAWLRAGEIPGYALVTGDGPPIATALYFKRLT